MKLYQFTLRIMAACKHIVARRIDASSIKVWRNHNKNKENTFEPPRGKTNNGVSEQARHKPACTSTEAGQKLEILELSRGGIVLSE